MIAITSTVMIRNILNQLNTNLELMEVADDFV